MIQRRHIEELDSAVRVASKAVTVGRLDDADALTRFLYERWYLGLSSQQAEVPASYGTTAGRTWQAWGPRWTPAMNQFGSDLVRLQLSVAPTTALHVLALVTQRAGGWNHPWRLTSSALDSQLATPEATSLCLPVESLPELRHEIADLVEELRPFLALGVPALTLRIGRGAALAQNPGDGFSFGENRCRLVARAVLGNMRSHHREQISRTMAEFADAGVDPERPYLEQATSWDRPWRAA